LSIIDRGIDQTIDYINNAIEAFYTNVAKFGTDAPTPGHCKRTWAIVRSRAQSDTPN
jgi:hypothetical protein